MWEYTVPPFELIVRSSLLFWFMFVVFRFVLRRDAGSLGLADILVTVLIADLAQVGMSGGARSIADAATLVATIAGWNYLIDQVSLRYPGFERFVEPPATPLIRHGRILRANLRRELLTEEELLSQVRQQGVFELHQVKHAMIEANGKISVESYARKNPG